MVLLISEATNVLKIAIDQAQEQNNKKIKSTSGYIDLVNKENDLFLKKLEVCWPEIYSYLDEVDGTPEPQGHKEKAPSFVSKFIDNCKRVYQKVVTNPFLSTEFCMLNSTYIFPDVIAEDSKQVFKIGIQQYSDFCKSRFVLGKDSLATKIPRNALKLPKDSDNIQKECNRISINESLLNKLRDSCKFRYVLAKEVFKYEWTRLPECFVTKDGTPYHNTKSTVLDCVGLEMSSDEPIITSSVVIDLSIMIRSHIIESGMTFARFASTLLDRMVRIANQYSCYRIDIVADQYHGKSIKYHTRVGRKKSQGQQIVFSPDTIIPDDFLANDNNKTKLNEFLCDKFADACPIVWGKEFCISNKLINVFTNNGQREILQPNLINIHEEADNRIIAHIDDLIDKGHKSVVVRTGDSDIIVILLSYLEHFLTKESDLDIFVEIKTSGKRRIFDMVKCYSSLGKNVCKAFPFFHCFTGADSTTSFFKISKKVWFASWMKFPFFDELCKVFIQMSYCPMKNVVINSQQIIQQFVVFTYSPENLNQLDINELRMHLFEKKSSCDLRCLPPSSNALELHCSRSAYQSGWIWGNTLSQNVSPSPTSWGWFVEKENLKLLWTSVSDESLEKAITICHCRTAKCNACKCAKLTLKCLTYCNCARCEK